ncbi:MAG: tripartite tricarboxylate transporter substrate binding protein [Candidatus Limnocylindrales bacterium]|nr:tripartite tricarboxylate transporter substrate binding protein [Candidatus Limnocylindrales bacterium]
MRIVALVILTLATLVSGVTAQEPYPTRAISIVNPFPPGGIADLTGRPLAATFERLLKQPVVVVNKAGAAGAVGAQFASVAKPDGYTLLIALVSISSTPEVDKLFGRPATYTRDQFVGIARLNADPPILVVNGPWKTLKELVDDAKKRPGEITFASSGPYGASHMPLEMFLQAAGLKMRHLPTTGGGPATMAVLGGHALLWASPPALAAPHIAAGKMRALATWGATRLAAFPDVPTLKELGYDVEYYIWTGLFAPRGIPAGVLQTLRDATRRAVQDDEFKAAMDKAKTPIAYQDADEFKAFWDVDAKRIASVIQFIGKTEAK